MLAEKRKVAGAAVSKPRHLAAAAPAPAKPAKPRLTRSEMRVLLYSSIGFSTPETADWMKRSPETIKSHREAIIRKFKARNMTHAIGLAFQHGILLPPRIEDGIAKPGHIEQMEERVAARAIALKS